jgi:hypothetical protein
MFQLQFSLPLLHGILFPTLLLAFGSGDIKDQNSLTQRVDLIELNHRYDDQGRHCYDQVIFYEWSPDYRRYHVVAWCLVDNGLSRLPALDHNKNRYVVKWFDRDSGQHRVLWAPIYRETWSDWDPERANKELMDEKYRVSLMRQQTRPTVR